MIRRIVSGGQTGVDRAALDAAIALEIPHGGWCPKGRKAEDGPIDGRYELKEMSEPYYVRRTEQNVVDSDATLIITIGEPTGGTKKTVDFAEEHSKPHLVVDIGDGNESDAAAQIRQWLSTGVPAENPVLNVAGPRGSKHPNIHDRAYRLLLLVFNGKAGGNLTY